MRTILFRGRRVDNDTWIYGDLRHWRNGTVGIHSDMLQKTLPVIPETVGQDTDMADKNGMRIFEGDIISAKLENGAYKDYTWPSMPVAFQQGAFCLIDKKGDIFCVLGAFVPSATFEVVGNIHDNKEMLCAEVEG